MNRSNEYYDKSKEHQKQVEPARLEAGERFDEEFASEAAPAPIFSRPAENRREEPNAGEVHSVEEETARSGKTVGWIGLVLAIASLFIYPVLLGLGAIAFGVAAFLQGSRSLGVWSASIGGVALLAYYVLVPYYT